MKPDVLGIEVALMNGDPVLPEAVGELCGALKAAWRREDEWRAFLRRLDAVASKVANGDIGRAYEVAALARDALGGTAIRAGN